MSIEDKLLRISAKYVFRPMAQGIDKADEYIKKKTGKSLSVRMIEAEEKDNKLREEKPLLWAAKKIGLGTLKGILGASVTKN